MPVEYKHTNFYKVELAVNKFLIIISLVLVVSCGQSQKEKRQVEMEQQRIEVEQQRLEKEASEKLAQEKAVRIAAVTCSIMSETRKMDAVVRVREMNDAREKIGGEPFLDGDDAIIEAFEYGLCQELVLNDTNAHADMRPTVKEELYSNGKLGWIFEQRIALDIRVIESALKFYRLDNYRYPTSSQGLEALIANHGGQDNWSGPYLEMPVDPWGQPYNYENPGRRGKEVDIYTLGVDNQAGGEGSNADWGNWNIK